MSRWLRLALAGALALTPALARAAGAEHEAEGGPVWWHVANLALLLGVLGYFGRKPVREFFAGRRREIESNLQRSAALLAESEDRLGGLRRRMDRLDSEVEEIRADARARAEVDRQRILAEASVAAERIRRDGALAIEQETRRAREQLHAEATAIALDLAADLLRERITDADRSRLVDEFIEQIQAPDRAPAGS